MTSLLELPTVRERVHRMSVDEYHRASEAGAISEKVELLRGIIFTKMAKSPLHEFVAQQLMILLLALIPKGFQVRPERPLTLRDSEPEPDLSVVRGHPQDWVAAHPVTAHLVVEVAVTSASVDESKAEIYAEANIPEYWLVRAQERTVDIHRDPTPEGYRTKATLTTGDTLQCASLPSVTFPVADIFPAKA
jgi:Uma2 family endonuclease